MLSIDCSPIPMDKAVKQGESRLLSVETNISNWQRKQNQNNNFSAVVPYDMERQREESREFLNDLVARDKRMLPVRIFAAAVFGKSGKNGVILKMIWRLGCSLLI